MPLFIHETHIDETSHVMIDNSDVYESSFDTASEAYHAMVREYGRCTGKVYIDITDDDGNVKAAHVGWTFLKRVPYDDAPSKTYLRTVWVTLHDGPAIVTKRHQHHIIGGGPL